MEIAPYGILFYDSFQYFRQSLSSLSARFSLPAYKGYAAFWHNKGRFWNIKTRNPPPSGEFYNNRNDQKTKEEKKLWWMEKSREKFYTMNAEILA